MLRRKKYKNTVLVFAVDVGQRMNSKAKPKQFLELHGKPILVYTLEYFQNNESIDAVVLVCVEHWIDYCTSLVEKYGLSKVEEIVAGGSTGQISIYNGLKAISKRFSNNSIVLIHDGVRPLINDELISDNINSVKKYGSAITIAPATETVIISENDEVESVLEREKCKFARAPQSFYLGDIMEGHLKAIEEQKFNFIDSSSLMKYYGKSLHTVVGPVYNIKITTPTDFYIFKAMLDARESSQLYGI